MLSCVSGFTFNFSFFFGLKDEAFLEDINMILNTGDVPNIYESDEKAEITEQVAFDFTAWFFNCFQRKARDLLSRTFWKLSKMGFLYSLTRCRTLFKKET